MSSQQAKKVLVVEDESMIALFVESDLEAAGYEVCGLAATEEGAVELAQLHRPDFAVVDVRLHEGCGFTVAKALQDAYGTAILFASGEPNVAERAQEKGVSVGFAIGKPYDAALVPVALDIMTKVLHPAGGGDVELPHWLIRFGN